MKITQFQTGDILLLDKDKAMGIYPFLKKYLGKDFADFLAKIEKHNYIHAELYLGNGYTLAAWFNGVHLVRYNMNIFSQFDVFRYKGFTQNNQKIIKENVKKYFNKEYDFVSLILNGLPEMLSLGIEPLEQYLQKQIPYSNPNKLICSELIARMYADAGIMFETDPEFVTPDDLAENKNTYRIL